MAGLAAAWRLSEPGWRDEFESITVYQRGWRLGGKGASGRGVHGRIEEHGLHIWLGYYENAFRLLRECYDELDRARTDPELPDPHLARRADPGAVVGLEDVRPDVAHWVGRLRAERRGARRARRAGGPMTVAEFVRRVAPPARRLRRVATAGPVSPAVLSAGAAPPPPDDRSVGATIARRRGRLARRRWPLDARRLRRRPPALDVGRRRARRGCVRRSTGATTRRRSAPGDAGTSSPSCWRTVARHRRRRAADRPARLRRDRRRGLPRLARRHGAAPRPRLDARARAVRPRLRLRRRRSGSARRSAPAGLFLSGKMFFDYKGAIFWKMTAGMGDVVFAPLYQALRRRGVRFEFFHRVDALHLVRRPTADRRGRRSARQATLARRRRPLRAARRRSAGCPCFPSAPLAEQLAVPAGVDRRRSSRTRRTRPRRRAPGAAPGDDFDVARARHPGRDGAGRLRRADRRPAARGASMVDHVRHGRHPGPPALAARGRADARLAAPA